MRTCYLIATVAYKIVVAYNFMSPASTFAVLGLRCIGPIRNVLPSFYKYRLTPTFSRDGHQQCTKSLTNKFARLSFSRFVLAQVLLCVWSTCTEHCRRNGQQETCDLLMTRDGLPAVTFPNPGFVPKIKSPNVKNRYQIPSLLAVTDQCRLSLMMHSS